MENKQDQSHRLDAIDPALFKYKMPLLQQPNCQRSSEREKKGAIDTRVSPLVCQWTEAESNASLKPASGHVNRGPIAPFRDVPAMLVRHVPETGNSTRLASFVKGSQDGAYAKPVSLAYYAASRAIVLGILPISASVGAICLEIRRPFGTSTDFIDLIALRKCCWDKGHGLPAPHQIRSLRHTSLAK